MKTHEKFKQAEKKLRTNRGRRSFNCSASVKLGDFEPINFPIPSRAINDGCSIKINMGNKWFKVFTDPDGRFSITLGTKSDMVGKCVGSGNYKNMLDKHANLYEHLFTHETVSD